MKKITPQDLPIKPSNTRRKTSRTPRKSAPQTPFLLWTTRNTHDGHRNVSPETRRKQRRENVGAPAFSSRKLGASLWRCHVAHHGGGDEELMWRRRGRREDGDGLVFKPEIGRVGHRMSHHHANRDCGLKSKDGVRSPGSVNGPINGFLCERQSPFRCPNYAMEGATKWDPLHPSPSDETPYDLKAPQHKVNTTSRISSLQKQLEEAQTRVHELESERRSSKKKLEHFLKKLSNERASWRSREHEKVRAIIDDVKSDLTRERKNRHRLEIHNSKLVNELAETKLSTKRYIQEYEKERKSRQLIEQVCDELAKEIGEDKAEVDVLKRECLKIRDEAEDERKMLQMAEVWREERVQMKLTDAKVTLDEKFSQMNHLASMMEEFLRLNCSSMDTNDVREAEMLLRAARSVSVECIKEFTYEPPSSDDIFDVVEEMAMAEEAQEKEIDIEPCGEYRSDVYVDRNGDDASGWETVSNADGHGSSSNVSGSCTEWEEHTGCGTLSDAGSVQSKKFGKVKSVARLWRGRGAKNGDSYKIISVDGSPDCSPLGLEEYGPPEPGRAHWVRGGPDGNLKSKVQLKHVLRQRS